LVRTRAGVDEVARSGFFLGIRPFPQFWWFYYAVSLWPNIFNGYDL